jgi:hypothetical protein
MIHIDKTISYLFDLADITEKNIADIDKNSWNRIISIAIQFEIHLYVFKWLKNNCVQVFSSAESYDFSRLLTANKIRNILLKKQIISLSSLLAESGVPHIFLKGSAGIARNLYDLECRYLSDIDLIIPDEFISRGERVLESNGYTHDTSQLIPEKHHHISPFYHPKYPGGVEIHCEPYMYSMLDRPAIPDLWNNSESIEVEGVKIHVPSITDHIWIALRTNLYPRLKQYFEIAGILKLGYSFDVHTLAQRAERDNIPHIIECFAYMCDILFDISILKDYSTKKLKQWDFMNRNFQKNIYRIGSSQSFRERALTVLFFTSNNIFSKIRFSVWMSRYEAFSYNPNSKILFHIYTLWRFVKDTMLTLFYYCIHFPAFYFLPKQRKRTEISEER